MIDIQYNSFMKLKKVPNKEIGKILTSMISSEVKILSVYKSVRNYVVFTNKQVIEIEVRGKKDSTHNLTFIPYEKIGAYSVKNVNTANCELHLYFSGLGRAIFAFNGENNVEEIAKIISLTVM